MLKRFSFDKTTKDHLTQARQWVLNSRWLERLARFGYAAKGIVYLFLGALTLPAAVGAAEGLLGMHGVLKTIIGGLLGPVILTIVGFGLGAYVFWRFVQAIVDPEQKGTGAKGLIQRGTYLVSGLVFANLTFDAVELIVDWSSSDNLTPEDWSRLLLTHPLGRWLVALAGVVVVGAGIYQFYAAYTAPFRRKFKLDELSSRARKWIILLGRFGHAARAIVFLLIGVFLILAALHSDPEQAGGLGDALRSLADQAYGPWALGGVALGLSAYGVYLFSEAWYRRIGAS